MITVREIDPADVRLFDAWYEVFRAGAVADREAAIVVAHDALASSLRTPNPIEARLAVAAFEGDRVVGAMLFEYRLDSDLDTVEVEIDVAPADRRRGIATALWGWARSRAAAEKRTIFRCEPGMPTGFTAETWPGSIFATKLGFTMENVEDHLVLELPQPVLRPAARGVVLDQDERVLLMRFEFGDGTVLWAAPGGGVEPGETLQEALARELREEIGLGTPPDPPHLWHQEAVADGHATGYDGVTNDYFLIRVESFTPAGTFTAEEMAVENVYGHRWWTLAEIRSCAGPDLFSPRALPHLLEALRQDGPPPTPVFQAL